MNAPPLETCKSMQVLFSVTDGLLPCAYCSHRFRWREPFMRAHSSRPGTHAIIMACIPCTANRAKQPDCKVTVEPGIRQVYDDWLEVDAFVKALPIGYAHNWCDSVRCKLCQQGLREPKA